MSDEFWRWAGKTLGKTQQTLEEARKEAERLAEEAGRGISSRRRPVSATAQWRERR
ncbi:MAG: hypothetical protein HC822_16590 [Oscillochloris sp.]|nr:hypothetical protein [Oscillochloris sp.]